MREWLTFGCVILALPISGCPATAQIVGDVELLKQVAVLNRANREAISTWEGQARIETRHRTNVGGSASDTIRVSGVEFAFDRASKRLMYVRTQTEERVTKGGEVVVNRQTRSWGRILTDDIVYEVQPWEGEPNRGGQARPVLLLDAPSKQMRGDFGPDFTPFLYLEVQGIDVYQRMMGFYDHAAELKRGKTSVARDGRRVVLDFDTGNIASVYVFDLDQGANPVEVRVRDKNIRRTSTREFQLVSGVWLPSRASAMHQHDAQGIDTEVKVVFTKHSVNKSISAEEFMPERLGIRKGDLVRDRRTGVEYYFEGSPGLARGWWLRNWRNVVVGAAGLLAALFTFLAWRIRRSRRQEYPSVSTA
jgi:hypothetical protein